MNQERLKVLKEILDQEHSWPDDYKFKFIVKTEKTDLLVDFLNQNFAPFELSRQYSKTKKYCSLTVIKRLKSSDEVLEIYNKVSVIDGVMSL